MPTIDDVVDRARIATGADFVFILTLRARLVTRNAPRDMPALGRSRIVHQALDLLTGSRIGVLTLPRQELVPFGGAAPVDVFVAVAANRAVIALVMSSWADKTPVIPGIVEAVNELEPLLVAAAGSRITRPDLAQESLPSLPRIGRIAVPPPLPPPRETRETREARETRETRSTSGKGKRKASAGVSSRGVDLSKVDRHDRTEKAKAASPQAPKGKRRGPMAGLISLAGSKLKTPPQAMRKPPRITINDSAPEITVSPATVGRATLEAIELDERSQQGRNGSPGSLRRGSMPDIRVELASISPNSERELRSAEAAQMQGLGSIAELAGPLVGTRVTQPWVEDAADAKRAADAALASRRGAPPKVTLKLEEADEEIVNALLADGMEPGEVLEDAPPPSSRRGVSLADALALLAEAPRPKLSSIETWRTALEQTIATEEALRR